jgi:uncharacterized membrane protein
MDITPAQGQQSGPEKRPATYGDSFKRMFSGVHFQFPGYKHDHPPVIDVNKVADDQLTVGQRVADKVAATVGSWRFIIIQSFILAVWLALNITGIVFRWDPYPFILLNLMLSFQAAYAAPFVMMSQNRQAEKDRLTAQNDYSTDCKGEEEIRYIMEHLDHQDTLILQIVKRLEEQHMEMKEHLARLDPALVQRLGTDIVKMSEESLTEDEEISGNS